MFKDRIEVLDFASHPERARGQINIFVEDATKNMITNLLPPDSIKTNTTAALINAVYFKGDWVSEFNKKATRRKPFYKPNRTPVYVDMMRRKGFFNYGMLSADKIDANATNVSQHISSTLSISNNRSHQATEYKLLGNAIPWAKQIHFYVRFLTS